MNSEDKQNKDFGRYQIKSLLGKGGFGTVYEALDKTLNRVVALKVVKEGVTAEGLARFQREADICVRLRHPNVITIYDAAIQNEKAFIVMERLQAQELRDLLADGPIDEEQALSIIVQIANAIDYLDKEGILHRDIKPENIMVAKDGRAVLMDFNLGMVDDMTALTATGLVVGTSRYMAPELWFGEPYTIASEIYALGLVFYYMLTGRPPPSNTVEEIRSGVEPLAPPSSINSQCQPSYDAFLAWITNPELSERCGSMENFLVGLSQTTESGKRIVSKHNPELTKNVNSVNVPEVVVPATFFAKKTRRTHYVVSLVCLVVLLIVSILVYAPSSPSGLGVMESDLRLCPFPDGCYALFKSKVAKAPDWKILSNRVVLQKGKCFPRGRYWLVDVRGLKVPGKLLLQLRNGNELIAEQEFRLTEKVFKEPIRAFVGKRKISLNWRLNGDVEALVKGRFTGADGELQKKLAQDTVSFQTSEKALYFYYDFFVGARKLASNKVRLSLVSRRNVKHFPRRPPWKIPIKPLVMPNGFLVVSGRSLSLLGIDRDGKGPIVSLRWQLPDNSLGAPIATVAEEAGWFFCLWHHRGKLHLSKVNSQGRIDGSKMAAKEIGQYTGEWCEKLTDRGKRYYGNAVEVAGKGLVAVAFVNNEDKAFVNLVDYRDEAVKVHHVVSLGRAEALWLGTLNGKLLAITANEGKVLQTCLSVQGKDAVITKSSQQYLFTEPSQGIVFTIGSQKKGSSAAERQKTLVELTVTPFANRIWAIRLGGNLGFFELKERNSKRVRANISLPVKVENRISNVLQIDDGAAAFVSVEVSRNQVPTSRAFLHKVDLSKPNGLVKKILIGKSVVFIDYEAICGGVGSWQDRYYIPALEYVHVISKRDGKHLGKFHAEQRPNYAVPFEGTLFVPLNTRRLLGIDLIDEF